jgi:hypothetical protein
VLAKLVPAAAINKSVGLSAEEQHIINIDFIWLFFKKPKPATVILKKLNESKRKFVVTLEKRERK